MTTALGRDSGRAGDGGIAARLAVLRWARRMLRREWRQQALVLALLTVSVAAATGLATAAYNLAPGGGNAEYGTANYALIFEDPDPVFLGRTIAAAEEWFGSIDVIGHRPVQIPGSVDTIDYRTQDPNGPYGAPLLDVREGRAPAASGEVAVTDGVAETFDLEIGSSFALDGVARTVVGIVENPSDLDDDFALLMPDADEPVADVTILVDADGDHVESFRPPGSFRGMISSRGDLAEDVTAAVTVLAVAAVALFLVALVASASFVVVAQRRLRQLGMLAAVGATPRHVRLVIVANGAMIGAIAAVLGTIVGVAGWVVLVPQVESAAGYRIDAFDLPWWLVITSMALAVLAATGAAWWPARTVARVPTVLALSGRPPRPRPVERSAALAGAFLLGGLVCLVLVGDVADEESVHLSSLLLVAAGTVSTVLGVLLFSPLAIRALARMASRLPVAVRLPLRDLGRYQARSGAALAAISLALGIPVAIVVSAAAAENAADKGNLSDQQLLVSGGELDGPFVPDDPAVIESWEAGVDRVAAALADPTVISLDVALDPALETPEDIDGRLAITLGERIGDRWSDVAMLYVATPELLAPYGVDLAAVDSNTTFLTTEVGDVRLLGVALPPGATRDDSEALPNAQLLPPGRTSVPGSFVTMSEIRDRGWEAVPSGRWLLETSRPLTGDELATARDIAAETGLTIEARDTQAGLTTLRSGATAVGMLLALGILAMTVGLIRSEVAADLRTLTATGATSGTRRTLAATTAGGLAVLGVVLGIVGAYLAITAVVGGDIGDLRPVPVVNLATIAVGTPVAAATAAWLLSGREPPGFGRQPIE